ncbi:uncharacterized protein LOC119683086 [Teleopsis dalmanni]|uniref:uncharacterized protein LOC119683086 n=1 Tax=Teleopsis dalmanni TaxID=139649 RepID=UPI0018CFA272|nr:uncharacterized protein LOC119683086 [Teleopsis dalmanni]
MAPMPSIKTVKPDTNFLYVGAEAEEESSDSSPIPSSPPSSSGQAKSQCSSLSDGESFEGYGENVNGSLRHTANGSANVDDNLNETGGVELQLSRFTPQSNSSTNNDDDLDMIPRDSWARRSLRRAPTSNPESLQHRRWGSMRHSGRRQLGSNALASKIAEMSYYQSTLSSCSEEFR